MKYRSALRKYNANKYIVWEYDQQQWLPLGSYTQKAAYWSKRVQRTGKKIALYCNIHVLNWNIKQTHDEYV